MFCPKCRCEFVGWTGKCPNCKTLLVEELAPIPETADKPISYEALVDLVRENGGQLRIDLSTTDVGMEKKRGFPYSGYGSAWTQEMSGECGAQLKADLLTTDVGRHKGWGFPYLGYRFAWANGSILTLTLNE